jgi:hypothetical protein
MYQKPRLQRFGPLSKLTLAGFQGASDSMTVYGISGNNCEAITQNPDGSLNFLGCYNQVRDGS